MAASSKQILQRAAVQAFVTLAIDRPPPPRRPPHPPVADNQLNIARDGPLPHIIRLARSPNDFIETQATLVLARVAESRALLFAAVNLSFAGLNRPKLLFMGGFKPLLYNAQYSVDPEVKKASLNVVGTLFSTKKARTDELVRKAVAKFKAGLKSASSSP